MMDYLTTIGRWVCLGLGFNVAQRALDYLLDHGFQSVTWLTWLAN